MGRKKTRTPESIREYKKLKAREYYKSNPKKIISNSINYSKRHPEIIKLRAKNRKETIFNDIEKLKRYRLSMVWYLIKNRCYDEKDKRYKHYGGKGVSVCQEWRIDKLIFIEWALSNGYDLGLSIDRINTNGNYEPGNCRWATQIVQQNNRTNNLIIEYNGEFKTMADWSRITGISQGTLHYRHKSGIMPPKLFKQAIIGCNKL